MGNGLPLFFILPCNNAGLFDVFDSEGTGKPNAGSCFSLFMSLGNNRTISALRLKHRSGSCGTASALPKCSIMSGCGTRIVLRGQKPLALCDRCPCFGSLFPPLAALTFAASSIICAFGLASAAPRSPYRHLELCGVALIYSRFFVNVMTADSATRRPTPYRFDRSRNAGRKLPPRQRQAAPP